jgi:hypothetical protein
MSTSIFQSAPFPACRDSKHERSEKKKQNSR